MGVRSILWRTASRVLIAGLLVLAILNSTEASMAAAGTVKEEAADRFALTGG
jgi:hypothetical protein